MWNWFTILPNQNSPAVVVDSLFPSSKSENTDAYLKEISALGKRPSEKTLSFLTVHKKELRKVNATNTITTGAYIPPIVDFELEGKI